MRKGSWLRAMLVLLVAIGLGSCGGGGGGGSPGFRVSFDTSALSFDLVEGQYPDAKMVTATAHGTPPASGIFVGAIVSGEGIQQPISISIDEASGEAYAFIGPMPGLAAGTYSGSVKLLACADELCSQHFAGSPHTVSYTITVHPRLKVAPVSAAFAVPEEQAVTPKTLALTLPDGVSAAAVTVTYGVGASGWLQVQSSATSLILSPAATGLAPGTYSAQVVLSAAGQVVYVPVTLQVTYDPSQHLRVDKTSVTLAGPEAQVLPAEVLQVGLPPGSASVTTALGYGAGASNWLQVQTSGTSITLTPSTVGLTPGNYSASLTLSDSASGESLVVPVSLAVSYDALQHLRVDQGSLAFAGVETQSLAGKALQFGLPPSATGLATSVSYGAGASNWLQVQVSGNELLLTVDSAGILAGSYFASLNLQATGTAEALVVPVSLTVSKGLAAHASQAVIIDMDASGVGQFVVQALSGVSTSQWTASSSQPWLVLDKASGAMGESVEWRIDPEQFAALVNNASHDVTVTIGGAGLTSVTRQLTFSKQLKQIVQIDTLALLAGESGDVMLYGEGFASLVDFAARLQLSNGLTPTDVTVLSDRVARFSLQNVPAGNYTVALASASNLTTRRHTLRVLEPQDFPAQVIPTTGRKGGVVWDPVSRAAFAVDLAVARIHRFGWDGSTFVHTTATANSPFTLVMDRARTHLLVAGKTGQLQRFDPATLESQGTQSLGVYLPEVSYHPLPLMGDNRMWVAQSQSEGWPVHTLLSMDLETGARATYSGNPYYFSNKGPFATVSANGQRMVMAQNTGMSPPTMPLWMDLANNVLSLYPSGTALSTFRVASSNRQGTRWLFNELVSSPRVYDYNLNILGNLTTGWGLPMNAALSRDGTRAYVYEVGTGAINSNGWTESTDPVRPRIYVMDTSSLPPSGTSYTVLGYFEVAEYAGCRGYNMGCYPTPQLALSEDDRTIITVGDRNFVVTPIPEQYRPGYVAPAPAATALVPTAQRRGRTTETILWRLPLR